jgi:MFS family permease
LSNSVPSNVKLLIYFISIGTVGYGFLLVVIAAYLPEVGINSGTVGAILAINGLASGLGSIPLGMLSDRINRKFILVPGTLVATASFLIFALTTQIDILYIGALLSGLSEGTIVSTWNAIIADKTDLGNRDSALSLSFVVTTLSLGLGSFIPLFLPYFENSLDLSSVLIHNYSLIFFAIANLISPIALAVILKDYHSLPRIVEGEKSKGNGNLGMILKFSGIFSLVGIGGGLIIPLLPTWLFLRFQISDTYSGPLIGVAYIGMSFASLLSPRLSRRFGSVASIVLTEGLSSIFMFSLAFVGNAVLGGVFIVLRSTLMNMSAPLADSFLMGIVHQDERGIASALSSVVLRLPGSVTTFIGGLILESGNYGLPFIIAGFFYVATFSLFYFTFRNVKPMG